MEGIILLYRHNRQITFDSVDFVTVLAFGGAFPANALEADSAASPLESVPKERGVSIA
jgi:hypothetical protein